MVNISCDTCGAREFEELNEELLKCNYCGNLYEREPEVISFAQMADEGIKKREVKNLTPFFIHTAQAIMIIAGLLDIMAIAMLSVPMVFLFTFATVLMYRLLKQYQPKTRKD